MPNDATLTTQEIETFVEQGYVAVRGAVPPDVVRGCRDMIWDDLARQGVERDDPTTWTSPVVRINCPEGAPFAAAGTQPRLCAAYDQLIGPGRWRRREGVGGTIPVRFPSTEDPGDAGWHIEGSYATDDGWGVNVRSRERGLLALFLFTDVSELDAPTRVRPGSHVAAARALAPAGDDGMAWMPAAQACARATSHLPTELVTGDAGDVFLCHPFLVHAASWPHRGTAPKLMAQPAVALHDQLPLTAPLSPVEQPIASALRHGNL